MLYDWTDENKGRSGSLALNANGEKVPNTVVLSDRAFARLDRPLDVSIDGIVDAVLQVSIKVSENDLVTVFLTREEIINLYRSELI